MIRPASVRSPDFARLSVWQVHDGQHCWNLAAPRHENTKLRHAIARFECGRIRRGFAIRRAAEISGSFLPATYACTFFKPAVDAVLSALAAGLLGFSVSRVAGANPEFRSGEPVGPFSCSLRVVAWQRFSLHAALFTRLMAVDYSSVD